MAIPQCAVQSDNRRVAGVIVRHINRTYPHLARNAGLFRGLWMVQTVDGSWFSLAALQRRLRS